MGDIDQMVSDWIKGVKEDTRIHNVDSGGVKDFSLDPKAPKAPKKKVAAPKKKVAAPKKKVAAPKKKVAAPKKKVALIAARDWRVIGLSQPVPRQRRRTQEREASGGFPGLCCDERGFYIGGLANDCRHYHGGPERCVVHAPKSKGEKER